MYYGGCATVERSITSLFDRPTGQKHVEQSMDAIDGVIIVLYI
jgi:hypothetical protein